MPEISVIVPVYNVEKYLDKCVRSIQAQTFSDLEIILVDDGSPDGCGAMCDAYAREDDRIQVIHKKNGGLSDARNAGIEVARGKYLGFVDSDDYIAPDMYEVLHRMMVEEDADVTICGIHHCYADGDHSATAPETYQVLGPQEIIRQVLESRTSAAVASAVNKLYKCELFKKLRFLVGKVAEDGHLMVYLLDQAKRVCITEAPKYYYIHHEGTITTQPFRPVLLSVIEAWEKNYVYVKEKYPALYQAAQCRYLWAYFYVLDRMMISPESVDPVEKQKIIRELRKNTWNILRNSHFQNTRKIAALALCVHESLYQICARTYWKRRGIIE